MTTKLGGRGVKALVVEPLVEELFLRLPLYNRETVDVAKSWLLYEMVKPKTLRTRK